jgi:predicted phosphoribosyltransferase
MIFRDRRDAGERLARVLLEDDQIKKNLKKVVIVGLLRGGVIVAEEVAKKLEAELVLLVVAKVGMPGQEELAVGAVCGDELWWNEQLKRMINKGDERRQIEKAKSKIIKYKKKFGLGKIDYEHKFKKKWVIVVDDGVATGATVKVAAEFVRTKKPEKLILAVPVAPTDFKAEKFDQLIALKLDPEFRAVGQYYKDFEQVEF